jgi:catechol 2,3-dioxygenase-like lactoylglutathione lyase family enzyme
VIDHLELRTNDVAGTVRFYADLLAPLGYTQQVDGPAKGFGDKRGLDFFIIEGSPSTDVHYAFRAASRAQVNEIYEIGRTAGYRLDRAPALAPHVHPNYYAAYLRDPDGRLVEFVCHEAQA